MGPGAAPIKTDEGWLSIYHGVFQNDGWIGLSSGHNSSSSLQNPAKIISVGDSWILQPEYPWEITGYVHNFVVFTCGAVPEPDGTVKIFWGAQHSNVRRRSEYLRSGCAMSAQRQTGKVSMICSRTTEFMFGRLAFSRGPGVKIGTRTTTPTPSTQRRGHPTDWQTELQTSAPGS